MPFPALFSAAKAVVQFQGWSEPEPETGYIWFNAPLEIGGVVETGLVLHGGCFRRIPDRNVTFELATISPGGRRVPLARADWRSLRGGHTNDRRPGSPVSGTRVSDCHHHAFELNWIAADGRMRRGNLPQAEELDKGIQSFESLRDWTGNRWNINNISVVLRPPWEYDLFADG